MLKSKDPVSSFVSIYKCDPIKLLSSFFSLPYDSGCCGIILTFTLPMAKMPGYRCSEFFNPKLSQQPGIINSAPSRS